MGVGLDLRVRPRVGLEGLASPQGREGIHLLCQRSMNINKLKQLEKLFLQKNVEKPEKGFFTRAELCRAWKVCEQHGNRKLKKYLESGLVETKNFRVTSGLVTRPVPHYRIKNEQNR